VTYEEEILVELRAIRELLEQSRNVTYNVNIKGNSADADRLQKVLDEHRIG